MWREGKIVVQMVIQGEIGRNLEYLQRCVDGDRYIKIRYYKEELFERKITIIGSSHF